MRRIFIALKVDPGETLLRIHYSLKASFVGERITWVDPLKIHLTLAFLGDIEDVRIKVISIMLKEKCSGIGKFSFLLAGAGVFKNYNDPRVIWIGIDHSEKLLQLNGKIINGLNETGFKMEDRPFRPHITLGRARSFKDPDKLKMVLEEYRNTLIQEVPANEVILFESTLKPTGSVYKPLGKFNLV